MTERMRNFNWAAIAFLLQLGAIVWMSSAAFTKLDYMIAKVDKMESREYTKEDAKRDWENQRVHNAQTDARLKNVEDFKKWRNER